MQPSDSFVRQEEAMEMINSEPDNATKQLMLMVIGSIALLAADSGVLPALPVDMVYLVHVLRETFRKKNLIMDILEGRDEGDWVSLMNGEGSRRDKLT